jgi:hypothetical protein
MAGGSVRGDGGEGAGRRVGKRVQGEGMCKAKKPPFLCIEGQGSLIIVLATG